MMQPFRPNDPHPELRAKVPVPTATTTTAVAGRTADHSQCLVLGGLPASLTVDQSVSLTVGQSACLTVGQTVDQSVRFFDKPTRS